MTSGRVFPSATSLGDGQILIMAGLNEKRKVNATPEVWDGRQWIPLHQVRNKESNGPTFQFLTSDGRIFRAGPEKLSDFLNLETLKWTKLPRQHRNEVRFNGTAVMYQQDKILLIGGCEKYNCEGVPGKSSAEIIDLKNRNPTWQKIPDMAFARHSHHATLLPDGTVLITGGTAKPSIYNSRSEGNLDVELWDPSDTTFKTMAPLQEARHFQSAVVLLPDARVMVAGGNFS